MGRERIGQVFGKECSELVIHCEPGSFAERYAKQYGLATQAASIEPPESPNNPSPNLSASSEPGYLICALPDQDVQVPSHLGGQRVLAIEARAGERKRGITEVVIEDGVHYLGPRAFCMCTRLKRVSVGSQVTAIGKQAFWGCRSLQSIALPSSLLRLGCSAFWACCSLEQVSIPSGVSLLAPWTFAGCSSLRHVRLSPGLLAIGAWAFLHCSSLSSLSIPYGTVRIGKEAFLGCTQLRHLYIPPTVEYMGVDEPSDSLKLYGQAGELWRYRYIINAGRQLVDGLSVVLAKEELGYRPHRGVTTARGNSQVGEAISRVFGEENRLALDVPVSTEFISLDEAYQKGVSVEAKLVALESPAAFNGHQALLAGGLSASSSLANVAADFAHEVSTGSQDLPISRSAASLESLMVETAFATQPAEPVGANGCLLPLSGEESCPVETAAFSSSAGPAPSCFTATLDNTELVVSRGPSQEDNMFKDALKAVAAAQSAAEQPSHAGKVQENSPASASSPRPNPEHTAPESKPAILSRGKVTASVMSFQAAGDSESAEQAGTGAPVPAVSQVEPGVIADSAEVQKPVELTEASEQKTCEELVPSGEPEPKFVGLVLNKWRGSEQPRVVLPGSLEDKPVVAVGERLMRQNLTVEQLVISQGIRYLGKDAFRACSFLREVSLPDSLLEVGENCFRACELLKNVALPGELSAIGARAFSGCRSITAIHCPNSLQVIGEGAFSGCANLTDVTLGAQLREIGADAFNGCSHLQRLFIPGCVAAETFSSPHSTSLFAGCNQLVIYCEANSPAVEYAQRCKIPCRLVCLSEQAQNSASNSNLFDELRMVKGDFETSDGSHGLVLTRYLGNEASVRVPESFDNVELAVIAKEAFANSRSLEEVILPANIKRIEARAFFGCDKLKHVVLPKQLQYLGSQAFAECSALRSINLPEGLEQISERTFMRCTSLSLVTMVKGLKAVSSRAFAGCSALLELSLPSGLLEIGEQALADCPGFRRLSVPSSVIRFGVGKTGFGSVFGTMPRNLVIKCEVDSHAARLAKRSAIPVESLGAGALEDKGAKSKDKYLKRQQNAKKGKR